MPFRPVEHWGAHLWRYIHTICIIDFEAPEENKRHNTEAVECLTNLGECIPCHHCRKEWQKSILELDELDMTRPMVLFAWSWKIHNMINEKLHKTVISYEDALMIYTKII